MHTSPEKGCHTLLRGDCRAFDNDSARLCARIVYLTHRLIEPHECCNRRSDCGTSRAIAGTESEVRRHLLLRAGDVEQNPGMTVKGMHGVLRCGNSPAIQTGIRLGRVYKDRRVGLDASIKLVSIAKRLSGLKRKAHKSYMHNPLRRPSECLL